MQASDPINFACIFGLLFFGVPNRGIRIAHWLPIVKDQPNESLVRNLGPDSKYLRILHQNFCSVFTFRDAYVVSIYETLKSKVAKVSYSSSESSFLFFLYRLCHICYS